MIEAIEIKMDTTTHTILFIPEKYIATSSAIFLIICVNNKSIQGVERPDKPSPLAKILGIR